MALLRHLWLENFRNYVELDLSLEAGSVVFTGDNGEGKSNVLEAVAYLGTLRSFRGAPPDALIRQGADRAIIRAEVQVGERRLTIEAEVVHGRANRIRVNKQRLTRTRDLVGLMPVTVFAPDDLDLVKGGPAQRRRYLDDLLIQLHPRNDGLRSGLDKILKQRNALLRSARGRMTPDVESTLAVWNAKLAATGEEWARARQALVANLGPRVENAYAQLAGVGSTIRLHYDPEWLRHGLLNELEAVAEAELRRGTTLVGPHRDEIGIWLSEMPARTHASQGEQRTIALCLRIAGHHEIAEVVGTSPVLLLDDAFSELDDNRAAALLGLLVAEQTLVTTATQSPLVEGPVQNFRVTAGTVASAGRSDLSR